MSRAPGLSRSVTQMTPANRPGGMVIDRPSSGGRRESRNGSSLGPRPPPIRRQDGRSRGSRTSMGGHSARRAPRRPATALMAHLADPCVPIAIAGRMARVSCGKVDVSFPQKSDAKTEIWGKPGDPYVARLAPGRRAERWGPVWRRTGIGTGPRHQALGGDLENDWMATRERMSTSGVRNAAFRRLA